jgi:hypothetical protein
MIEVIRDLRRPAMNAHPICIGVPRVHGGRRNERSCSAAQELIGMANATYRPTPNWFHRAEDHHRSTRSVFAADEIALEHHGRRGATCTTRRR